MLVSLTEKENYILNMAMRRLYEGAYTCAIECCCKILNKYQTMFEAHFIKGCAHYNLKQYEIAENEFLCALKHMPLTKECYSNLALSAVKCGDSSVVHIIENAANNIFPNADLYMMCGILYANIEDYEKAFKYFNEAHRASPSSAAVYINVGSVMLERPNANKNDFLHAACCFTKAIKLAPLNKYAYYNRCKAYLKLKRGEEALNDANSLLFIERSDAGFYYIYGNALVLLKRYEEAREYYEKAISFGNDYVSKESRKRITEIKKHLQPCRHN